MTNAAERSGRVLGRADCKGAVDGSGSLSFSGGALVRTGYACQAVVTLPVEPTATLSWLVTLNTLPLFPLPGGSSLGPMTILDGDTLTFSCTSGLVEGEEYEATLIGYRVALDDPDFQFLLPTGVAPTVASGGGGVSGITEIISPDSSVDVINGTGPVVGLEVVAKRYASLTGVGEDFTPGGLTQAGDFVIAGGLEVSSALGDAIGFKVLSATAAGIDIEDTSAAGAGVSISSAAGFVSLAVGDTAGLYLFAAGTADLSGPAGISLSVGPVGSQAWLAITGATGNAGAVTVRAVNTSVGLIIANSGDLLGFFGHTPAPQPSGAGITTVPELVAALQGLGILG
jgi:hypothetical protein